MTTNEPNAPANTTRRGWRMARIAAMRNVLSPISEKMIMKKELRRALSIPSESGGCWMALLTKVIELAAKS